MRTNRVELAIIARFPFADGREFGAVGVYEGLVGLARFAVDPNAAAQHGGVDLDKAPREGDGRVHDIGLK